MKIQELRKKDIPCAIDFAIEGMHFNWYLDSKVALQLYGRYFWYAEMTRATQIIAAYEGDRLAGVLMADMKGEPKKYRSWGKSLYVSAVDTIQRWFAKGSVGAYDHVNQEMFAAYEAQQQPDGELCFLAADPHGLSKGVGSALLAELERREAGKQLHLYTDDGCSYPFYEHRGFRREQERMVPLELGKKTVNLRCFLYSKRLGKVQQNKTKE